MTWIATGVMAATAITVAIVKSEKAKKTENSEFIKEYDNTISLNAETTINLFDDLGYDLNGIRAGQKVKPIYLTKLPKDINWHMIGHLQTNKVKFIAPFVSLIHGVDSIKLLKEIDKRV